MYCEGEHTYIRNPQKLLIDAIFLHLLSDEVGHTTKQRRHRGDLAIPADERADSRAIDPLRFGATIRILHLLACHHVPPPRHSHRTAPLSFNEQGREDSIRRNNIELLLGLVRDGRYACIGNVADDIAGRGVRDIVHRSVHSRNTFGYAVARPRSLSIGVHPLDDVDVVVWHFKDFPLLVEENQKPFWTVIGPIPSA